MGQAGTGYRQSGNIEIRHKIPKTSLATRNKRETEYFPIVSGWTLIGSTNLLIINKLVNFRRVFDGAVWVHETRDYRRMAGAKRIGRLRPSNKDICTDAETVPERLHVRRGQAAFTFQDSVGDRTVDIKDSG